LDDDCARSAISVYRPQTSARSLQPDGEEAVMEDIYDALNSCLDAHSEVIERALAAGVPKEKVAKHLGRFLLIIKGLGLADDVLGSALSMVNGRLNAPRPPNSDLSAKQFPPVEADRAPHARGASGSSPAASEAHNARAHLVADSADAPQRQRPAPQSGLGASDVWADVGQTGGNAGSSDEHASTANRTVSALGQKEPHDGQLRSETTERQEAAAGQQKQKLFPRTATAEPQAEDSAAALVKNGRAPTQVRASPLLPDVLRRRQATIGTWNRTVTAAGKAREIIRFMREVNPAPPVRALDEHLESLGYQLGANATKLESKTCASQLSRLTKQGVLVRGPMPTTYALGPNADAYLQEIEKSLGPHYFQPLDRQFSA
jgi:hypothetical protein